MRAIARLIRQVCRARSPLIIVAVAVCGAGLVLAPVSLVAQTQDQSALPLDESDYEFGSGDLLRIIVFGHEDLSGEYRVSASGKISLPLVGDVKAKGLTPGELERAVIAKLQPDYLVNPRVAVEVLEARPFYILGEVNNPGGYPYVPGMTVLNAVALAGGFTYRADEDEAYIRRGGPDAEEVEVDIRAPVQPGDIVRIDERFF